MSTTTMDYAAAPIDARTEDVISDKQRLDAFRLGSSVPTTSSANQRAHEPSHSRSHSRHTSVSVPSFPVPSNTSTSPSLSSPPASPPLPTGGSKRNSHHRRRSSVSTRRESAELMGLALPSLPAASNEDNINLGDKDSIRRRALWALEGKTEVGSFSKVEIPELTTPDIEKRFDFPTKPSYPPGIGAGYNGLNTLAPSKRDSFGKFMSLPPSKEQLGTLMEEEEEEDENTTEVLPSQPAPVVEAIVSPVTVTFSPSSPVPAPSRPRPATLNLRPLSLAPNLVAVANNDLPTPSPTPSPRPRPGLRSLTLSPSLSSDSVSSFTENAAMAEPTRRHSLIQPTCSTFTKPFERRSSVSESPDLDAPGVSRPSRRSSISYFSSAEGIMAANYGLPTPEMTPTSDKRYSQDSVSSDQSRSSRGSHASEHHFLYQAHNALVQRICDLERALAARPRSRPQSCASDISSHAEAPTDEMFQLIADLKSERDELKKDIDGWRTRVADGEHQISLLVKRVEAERREAWVGRERLGLLEYEKTTLETSLADKTAWGEDGWKKYNDASEELSKVQQECARLREEAQRRIELEAECAQLAADLAEERCKREEAERELDTLLSTPTPQAFDLSKFRTPPVSRTMIFAKRGGLGFRSDSSSSCTDVDSIDDSFDLPQLSLKVVQEEEEDAAVDMNRSEAINELASYEEEDENDAYAFNASLSDGSFDSDYDDCREASRLIADSTPELSTSRSNSSSPAPPSPSDSHARRASLSKAWIFPHSFSTTTSREPEEIDRFFGCLEDVDNSPPLGSNLRSVDSGKSFFSQALADGNDDFPPFMIPADVGVELPSTEAKTVLDVVEEVDEEDETVQDNGDDEFVGEEVEGGIIFTFSPPPALHVSADEDLSLEKCSKGTQDSKPLQLTKTQQIASSTSSQKQSPSSSLPRPAPSKSFTSSIPAPFFSTPAKSGLVRFPRSSGSPALSTPTKNSSIPRSSSALPAVSTPPKAASASFIPQPRKSPASAAHSSPSPSKAQSKPRTSTAIPMRRTQPTRARK